MRGRKLQDDFVNSDTDMIREGKTTHLVRLWRFQVTSIYIREVVEVAHWDAGGPGDYGESQVLRFRVNIIYRANRYRPS